MDGRRLGGSTADYWTGGFGVERFTALSALMDHVKDRRRFDRVCPHQFLDVSEGALCFEIYSGFLEFSKQ